MSCFSAAISAFCGKEKVFPLTSQRFAEVGLMI
jgi:hypothetical protein